MGMESISRVTAAQSYQANTAASQPAPVTNVEAIDTAQNKQADVVKSQLIQVIIRLQTILKKMLQQ